MPIFGALHREQFAQSEHVSDGQSKCANQFRDLVNHVQGDFVCAAYDTSVCLCVHVFDSLYVCMSVCLALSMCLCVRRRPLLQSRGCPMLWAVRPPSSHLLE